MTNNQSQILVSICCITYNHAPFIRKALDGFLMQEPPTGVSADERWYEILIHDDCSSDGTTDIIREYAAKYPNKIFPLYETENQFSKVGTGGIDMFNYNRARGKYIAYCEGDDYWTDSYKLQKQVDFMESHQDYSVCWHRVLRYDMENNSLREDDCESYLEGQEGVDVLLMDTLDHWYTQPLSMLFRVSEYDFTCVKRYKYYRDMHEIYHLLNKGHGYLFSFIGGIYVIHKGGVSGGITQKQFFKNAYQIDKEFYSVNRDYYSRETFKRTLDYEIATISKSNKIRAISLIYERFRLMKDWKKMFKQLYHLCK